MDDLAFSHLLTQITLTETFFRIRICACSIIPLVNDSGDELSEIARFIAEVGVEIPWHISQFYPQYKFLDAPPTPIATLHRQGRSGSRRGSDTYMKKMFP